MLFGRMGECIPRNGLTSKTELQSLRQLHELRQRRIHRFKHWLNVVVFDGESHHILVSWSCVFTKFSCSHIGLPNSSDPHPHPQKLLYRFSMHSPEEQPTYESWILQAFFPILSPGNWRTKKQHLVSFGGGGRGCQIRLWLLGLISKSILCICTGGANNSSAWCE